MAKGPQDRKQTTTAHKKATASSHQKRLLDLIGKLDWDETFDYKGERSRK